MAKNIYTPVMPLRVESNQYGWPCRTYYYIVDANGFIFHQKDKVWRKKPLIEMTTYIYRTESSAETTLQYLTTRFNKV